MIMEKHYKSLLKSVEVYENLLLKVSEEDFIKSPPGAAWSFSETFAHIFQSNLLSLMAADRCILSTGSQTFSTKRIHWIAWLILFFGRFPPIKIKAPANIRAMVKKISKEDARNLIANFKIRFQEVSLKIDQADPHQKVKHPKLGLLNAAQWLRFIEVHTFHHTKQLKRIGRQLKIKIR